MNVSLCYDPIGWGVPYANALVPDDRETLVDLSLQVLLVLLDFGQSQTTTTTTTNDRKPRDDARVASTVPYIYVYIYLYRYIYRYIYRFIYIYMHVEEHHIYLDRHGYLISIERIMLVMPCVPG